MLIAISTAKIFKWESLIDMSSFKVIAISYLATVGYNIHGITEVKSRMEKKYWMGFMCSYGTTPSCNDLLAIRNVLETYP